jgi:hypothetical protein
MTTMRFEDRLLRIINRRLFYLGLTASAVVIGLTIAVTALALKRVRPMWSRSIRGASWATRISSPPTTNWLRW